MAIFESNCFTDDLLSCTPKVLDNGTVQLGTRFIGVSEGKITSASWRSDGVLVVNDVNGGTHFFTGTQKYFSGHNGEVYNAKGLKDAIEECQKERSQVHLDKEAKTERKKSKKSSSGSSKGGSCFCSIFKILWKLVIITLKTLLGLIGLGCIIDSMDD